MSGNNVLLSMCIATYNRSNFLPETLESILSQINDEVEIVIVDGNSTDDTETVVKSYSRKYENVRYIKLLKKGGVDKDYSIAVEVARGRMCWLFSDDDVLEPGSIDRVLEAIKKSYSLIIVNSNVKDVELDRLIEYNKLNIHDDVIVHGNDVNTLFELIVPYVSFIGCVVIDRETWLKRNYRNYYETEFIHVGVIFENYFLKNTLLMSKPFINIRSGNAQWTNRGFKIWKYNWPRLLNSFNMVDLNLRMKHVNFNTLRNFKDLMIYRSEGTYNFQLYFEYLNWNSSNSFFSKAVMIVISLIPVKLVYLIKHLYLFKKKTKR